MKPLISLPRIGMGFGVLIVGVLALASSARGADKPETRFPHSLFDGLSLAGWTIENDCEAGVDQGMLRLKAGNGWLRTHHTYGDFLLHVEWKALKTADYDAGIYIRTQPEGKPFPKDGYQINLLQGKEGNIGNLPGASSMGLIKPAEWNTFDIMVVGDTVALSINGKDAYKVAGLKHSSGYVGLQCEVPKGGEFLFRNIRIVEFGSRALFNGTDLAGWEGAGEPAEKCWIVKDDLLQCTGAAGPWLRSKEEFDDFNLRLDYQVSPGGNSGVYVRVPADGNHHREDGQAPAAGFEVQILDDAASQHKDLKDYQYSASVYDIAGATKRVSKPAGEWNTLEINARGQRVAVTHNGVVVVDLDEEKFPLIKLRQTKGFLGLQNHSTLVKFRNLRIGPPVPFPRPQKIADRLKKRISVEFRRTFLYEAVGWVGEQTGVETKLDGNGMKREGITQNQYQTFKMENVPAAIVLQEIMTDKVKRNTPLVLIVDEDAKTATITGITEAIQKNLKIFPLGDQGK